MAIWDKLKDGIDKVEKVAGEAFDEGKTRLDARRARQTADQAAEALGYAVFRAWEQHRPLEPDTLDRLARALRDHEAEARRLEQAASGAGEWRRRTDRPDAGASNGPNAAPAAGPSAEYTAPPSDPPHGSTAP